MRRLLALLMACASVLLAQTAVRASDCLVCHGAMQGKISLAKGETIEVHVDSAGFTNSVHGKNDCTTCHLTFSPGAHLSPKDKKVPAELASLVPFTSLKAKGDPVALAACVNCHQTEYKEFQASVHGRNIFVKKESDAPLCLDCHGDPHYILAASDKNSKVNHANLLETCGRCHENEELDKKYGMSPYVIEKYKESFHGKKYILGDKRVPICNDCHGSHGITRVDASASPVTGLNKIKTCGRCHAGAGAKFAAAPAHKYIGAGNPIPFYGEKLLIVLVFGVFIFTISHVVLESWSEIRDNVLRKDKKKGHGDE